MYAGIQPLPRVHGHPLCAAPNPAIIITVVMTVVMTVVILVAIIVAIIVVILVAIIVAIIVVITVVPSARHGPVASMPVHTWHPVHYTFPRSQWAYVGVTANPRSKANCCRLPLS